jgi:hypothetical protein
MRPGMEPCEAESRDRRHDLTGIFLKGLGMSRPPDSSVYKKILEMTIIWFFNSHLTRSTDLSPPGSLRNGTGMTGFGMISPLLSDS